MKSLGMIGILSICVAASAGAQGKSAGQSEDIPDEYRPPKGMCRVWLKDVPPAQQPAPTDCATAVKKAPPNGRVIFGDTEEVKNKPKSDPKDLPNAKGLTGKPGSGPPVVIKPRKPPTS